MNAPIKYKDWQKWSARLDAQPSNRRLVLEARTPRQMRDAGFDPFPAHPFTLWVDDTLSVAGFIGAWFVFVFTAVKIWGAL